MSYNNNYDTRITAKVHKTKYYTKKELDAVRKMIKQYIQEVEPEAVLNSNEANYTALSEAINTAYKEEVVSTRFIYDIYRQNSDNQKKNIRKMNAITEFLHGYFQIKPTATTVVKAIANEPDKLMQKIEEMQYEIQMLTGWMQQLMQKVTTSANESSRFANKETMQWMQTIMMQQQSVF